MMKNAGEEGVRRRIGRRERIRIGTEPGIKKKEKLAEIKNFVSDLKNYPIHSNGILDAPKVLADIIESLLGAVYVDTNKCYETVWKIFIRLSQPFITMETLGQHPVTELHELCQKLHCDVKFNNNWAQNQTIDVLLDEEVIGSATYGLKKETCHNRAAKVALDQLKELLRNNKLGPAPWLIIKH
ncbi:ribonuclease 3-like protein 3 isoform X1 [Carex littledalei]|uniref:Ribonuclease 3-like protein 3 isoform X1 n=1 Tax=Carex littledalei TaxID=544730 RepID=A0A833VBN1_9POAL|nr:ribonuclease 3-like protein 3 isoform X1 [Carex littledalei]